MRKEVVGIVLIAVFVLAFGIGEYFLGRDDVRFSPKEILQKQAGQQIIGEIPYRQFQAVDFSWRIIDYSLDSRNFLEDDILIDDRLEQIEYNGYIVRLKTLSVVEEKVKLEKMGERGIESALAQQKILVEHEQESFKNKFRDISIKGKVTGKVENVLNAVFINNEITKVELNELRSLPEVERIAPNYRVYTTLDDSVPLINADDVWSLDSDGEPCVEIEVETRPITANAIKGIGVPTDGSKKPIEQFESEVKECLTGKGITIGVIDSGVDYTHPDLDEGKVIDQYCYCCDDYSGESCGDEDPGCCADGTAQDNNSMDDFGHGTHVASIAAGNGLLQGVAPDANIVAYKVLDENGGGWASDILSAIERSVDPNQDGEFSDHLDVISMSLGRYCGVYSIWCGPDDMLSSAVDISVDAGIVVVISAGNWGPFTSSVSSPGTSRKAITIGAVNKTDGLAWWSSRGPVISNETVIEKPDLSAPGVDICAAQSSQDTIWDEIMSEGGVDIHCLDSNHISISGTSMAAPHVAGTVALMLQKNESISPEEIKRQIKGTVKDIYNKNMDLIYNQNIRPNNYEYLVGNGMVDTYESVMFENFQPRIILSNISIHEYGRNNETTTFYINIGLRAIGLSAENVTITLVSNNSNVTLSDSYSLDQIEVEESDSVLFSVVLSEEFDFPQTVEFELIIEIENQTPDFKFFSLPMPCPDEICSVCTIEDLDYVRYRLDGDYVQSCEINLLGLNWKPVGNVLNPFRGKYNGNGRSISNLFHEYNGYYGATGLFGETLNATLTNINLVNANITGHYPTGALIGWSENTFLDNISITGDVGLSSNYWLGTGVCVGGVAGMMAYNASIQNSSFEGNVEDKSGYQYAGGLIGCTHMNNPIIGSYATGKVRGGKCVGGLIGWLSGGLVYKSYADVDVFGNADDEHWGAGGLIGCMWGPPTHLRDSYARGDVFGNYSVGGLVGSTVLGGPLVENSYSTGKVEGEEYVGGSIGNCDLQSIPNHIGLYWDMNSSDQIFGECGEGRTTEEMTSVPRPVDTYVDWDFENVWCQEDGHYPMFECGMVVPCEPQHQCRSDGCGQDPVPEGDAWCEQEYGLEYQCCVRTMPLTCRELSGVCMLPDDCNVILASGDECADEGYPGYYCCEKDMVEYNGSISREASQREPASEQRVGVSVEKEEMAPSPEGEGFWDWFNGLFG